MRFALATWCLIAAGAASVGSGCSDGKSAASGQQGGKAQANAVKVPDLIGMKYRPTQEVLAKLGLRWGAIGTSPVQSKPPPDNVSSSADDDFVTDQIPKAGTEVERGA